MQSVEHLYSGDFSDNNSYVMFTATAIDYRMTASLQNADIALSKFYDILRSLTFCDDNFCGNRHTANLMVMFLCCFCRCKFGRCKCFSSIYSQKCIFYCLGNCKCTSHSSCPLCPCSELWLLQLCFRLMSCLTSD